ncbi:hypothetical protein WN48_05714 [Eufriesea mexicana]|nr:hypothetical protein WN48_05714 [Eufriesea mexicana]
MCARLLACPLCSQPGFLTLDALRAGLISVATRPLTCPVCNEILLGIDKLTIHLFSHTINLSNNNTGTYTDISLEKANDKNVQEDSTTTYNESENESFKHKQILPQLKFIKTLPSAKQKTEQCNICGFHFPDHNILFLHKQLVHMIHEKDLNIIPENLLNNYSCHLCSKVFKMRGSLMVHMRVAHMGYNLGSLAKNGQIELIFNENKYNCPTCGKKFKKEQHVMQHLKTHEAKQWECDVSQRTHKCPVQQIGNMQQTNATDQKSINLLNMQVEEYTETNNENEETKNIWKSDIPNNSIFKKSPEICKTMYSKNEKPFQEDTNDFLSMVISPFENGLSSPTIEMEHLRVSSPTQKEDILKSYDTFKNTTHDIEMNMFNTDIEPSFGDADSNVNNLQTINEESLKQLLYSINEK